MYPWNDPTTPKHTLRSVYEAFRFYIPFTLTGALTVALSLYLFVHGLATRNIYELVLAAFSFCSGGSFFWWDCGQNEPIPPLLFPGKCPRRCLLP